MRENSRQPPANTLIIFTRYPEPGKTKTRLIAELGPEGAAWLQRRLTEKTLATAVACADIARIEIHYTGAGEEEMRTWLDGSLPLVRQRGATLGERLLAAASKAFANGCGHLSIIGADCPDLDGDALSRAFSLLATHDLVIGPATDGGYYLIGMNAVHPELFSGIAFGSNETRAATMAAAARLGLKTALLDERRDIDRPEDLLHPVAQEFLEKK